MGKVKVTSIDGLTRFKSLCSKRRACLVVGYRSKTQLAAASQVLTPFLAEHRSVRVVALDLSIWRFRVDSKFESKRTPPGADRAELVCFRRGERSKRSGA